LRLFSCAKVAFLDAGVIGLAGRDGVVETEFHVTVRGGWHGGVLILGLFPRDLTFMVEDVEAKG
jgi:hypothetical protein